MKHIQRIRKWWNEPFDPVAKPLDTFNFILACMFLTLIVFVIIVYLIKWIV
jgi:hypothetical protein